MKNIFFRTYLNDFIKLLSEQYQYAKKLLILKKIIIKLSLKNKIFVFGNGGSASIANHLILDLNNIGKKRCINFNDPSLITCFANDYGYENWMKKCIENFGDKGDILIVISSSGESKNIVKACKLARQKNFKKIVTFTGFYKNNNVKKIGDINFWINSKRYNFIENIHQILLLALVDSFKSSQK
jgi:D-sedoheptulose 7-phosphate isomerase